MLEKGFRSREESFIIKMAIKEENQSAGGVPFFLNSNDHFTPVSFMVQANSVGRAEGGNSGRNTRRPLSGFGDHFRSFWIPSIVTSVVEVAIGDRSLKIPYSGQCSTMA